MITPKCCHFGSCGGCAYQDRLYDDQLKLKQACVEEAFSPFGPIEIRPMISSPKPYHYRYMLSPSVKKRFGELRMGFMGRNRRDFIPIEACAIADERLNEYLPHALRRLNELPEKRRFRTSQIVLRVGEEGEVVTSLREDRGKVLEVTVDGKRFSYAISSFFQHNFSVLSLFVGAVRSCLGPTRTSVLLDLYCGVGLFAISLAGDFAEVVGIEEGYEAIEQAKRNALRNGVNNISFEKAKVEERLASLVAAAQGNVATVMKNITDGRCLQVIIDPPRAGLKPEVIRTLCDHSNRIERLVYVSCELIALKRDLELLQRSFVIQKVQPIDLFPQTAHLETIVLLAPKADGI